MSRRGILAALEVRIEALVKLTSDNGVTLARRAAGGPSAGQWGIRSSLLASPIGDPEQREAERAPPSTGLITVHLPSA